MLHQEMGLGMVKGDVAGDACGTAGSYLVLQWGGILVNRPHPHRVLKGALTVISPINAVAIAFSTAGV